MACKVDRKNGRTQKGNENALFGQYDRRKSFILTAEDRLHLPATCFICKNEGGLHGTMLAITDERSQAAFGAGLSHQETENPEKHIMSRYLSLLTLSLGAFQPAVYSEAYTTLINQPTDSTQKRNVVSTSTRP